MIIYFCSLLVLDIVLHLAYFITHYPEVGARKKHVNSFSSKAV